MKTTAEMLDGFKTRQADEIKKRNKIIKQLSASGAAAIIIVAISTTVALNLTSSDTPAKTNEQSTYITDYNRIGENVIGASISTHALKEKFDYLTESEIYTCTLAIVQINGLEYYVNTSSVYSATVIKIIEEDPNGDLKEGQTIKLMSFGTPKWGLSVIPMFKPGSEFILMITQPDMRYEVKDPEAYANQSGPDQLQIFRTNGKDYVVDFSIHERVTAELSEFNIDDDEKESVLNDFYEYDAAYKNLDENFRGVYYLDDIINYMKKLYEKDM